MIPIVILVTKCPEEIVRDFRLNGMADWKLQQVSVSYGPSLAAPAVMVNVENAQDMALALLVAEKLDKLSLLFVDSSRIAWRLNKDGKDERLGPVRYHTGFPFLGLSDIEIYNHENGSCIIIEKEVGK